MMLSPQFVFGLLVFLLANGPFGISGLRGSPPDFELFGATLSETPDPEGWNTKFGRIWLSEDARSRYPKIVRGSLFLDDAGRVYRIQGSSGILSREESRDLLGKIVSDYVETYGPPVETIHGATLVEETRFIWEFGQIRLSIEESAFAFSSDYSVSIQIVDRRLEPPLQISETRELFFLGTITLVRRVEEPLDESIFRLGISQQWIIEIAVESIGENPVGIRDSDRVMFAIPISQALGIGVDDGIVQFPGVREYVLGIHLNKSDEWKPISIRGKIEDSNPLFSM